MSIFTSRPDAFFSTVVFGALQHLSRFGACSPAFLALHATGVLNLYQYCIGTRWAFTSEQRRSLEDMVCAVQMFSGAESTPPRADEEQQPDQDFLAKFEACLRARTSHFVLVLDGVADASNVAGIFRTAESLGVLHVWIVSPWERHRAPGTAENLRQIAAVSKKSEQWLCVRRFADTGSCVAALREEGREIWASVLHHPRAVALEAGQEWLAAVGGGKGGLPPRFALVVGCERTGISQTMHDAADRAVRLPMHGLSESLNVNVAAALLIQRVFDLWPAMRGDLSTCELDQQRSNATSRGKSALTSDESV